MNQPKAKQFWPELPCGRFEIDNVHSLLEDWAELAELAELAGFAPEDVEKNDLRALFQNSVIHVIESALILWLAPYAQRRGASSAIFQNINEFMHAFSGPMFSPGYPREMAAALIVCYSLERPWELLPEAANNYVDELIRRIKDIALYEVESSEFWRQRAKDEAQKGVKFKEVAEKFTTGRKPGARSIVKKYVGGVVSSDLTKSAKELWKVLMGAVADDADDEKCSLYVDGGELFETASTGAKYTFKRFQNHLTEFKKSQT